MNIRVKLFATLRQLAGWSERQVAVDEGISVQALLEKLAVEYPDLELADRTAYAAVNQQYAQGDQLLVDGDIVALFPPVSGGRV